MIAPFPPAGAVDIVARFIAPCLGAAVNRLIVIENRQGAGGSIVSMAWHSQSMP